MPDDNDRDLRDRGLEAAIAYVGRIYAPLGIVVCGSIVRGEAGPNSDYDIVVVHDEPWRVRDQRRFEGVPVELFVNPPASVRRYFQLEHAQAKPGTAHMLATGRVLDGAAPVVHHLVAEAHQWLAKPPPVPDLVALRYFAVDLLDDARDATDAGDDTEAFLIMARAVDQLVAFAFRSRELYLPHRKRAVRELERLDHGAADLVRRFGAVGAPDRLATVVALANHVIGVDTFFGWTSDREPVEA